MAAKRPGRPKESNRYRLQIRQPADLVEKMRQVAIKLGANVGAVYTMAAKDYLAKFSDDLNTS